MLTQLEHPRRGKVWSICYRWLLPSVELGGLPAPRYEPFMADLPSYEHFEHQADMGVRGYGRTREEAFEQVALALVAVMVPPHTIEPCEVITVECRSDDQELLLLDWLGTVVYQMAARRMVFGQFRVTIAGERLDGELFGEPLVPSRHQPGVEVKAATPAELRVARLEDGSWFAQCIVDV